ncbi:MAG: hypothetical protein R2838_16415 [Caldilineaceae bacterium]
MAAILHVAVIAAHEDERLVQIRSVQQAGQEAVEGLQRGHRTGEGSLMA